MFDNEYYSHDVDKEKPVFPDDEDDDGPLLLLNTLDLFSLLYMYLWSPYGIG